MAIRSVDRAVHATLGLETVETVNLTEAGGRPIRIVNSGATDLYCTFGNSTNGLPADPTVGGANTFIVQAGKEITFNFGEVGQVKLIASLAVTFSVEALG